MVRQEIRFIDSDGGVYENKQDAMEAEALIAVRKAVQEEAIYGDITVEQVMMKFKDWYGIYDAMLHDH